MRGDFLLGVVGDSLNAIAIFFVVNCISDVSREVSKLVKENNELEETK